VTDLLRSPVAARRLTDAVAADYLEYHGLLPLEMAEGRLTAATWLDEPDSQALDDLSLLFDASVDLVRGGEGELRQQIRRLYGSDAMTAEDVIAEFDGGEAATVEQPGAIDDLVSLASEAPVVRLVNLLLTEALEARASDVHLEASANQLRARYRIDGVLQDAPSPPRELAAAVISRLKIMADLDIAERRVPQDGRIRLTLRNRQVDVRVSTIPILHGESVVLRLLDKEQGRVSLNELGMGADTIAAFAEAIARPHGIVLATGPTGSGKTTTLYAAVERVHTGREKILTVEDPVEYELPGVAQMPVHEKVGVTFASALRALLRQDPDVMLVGEIRDEETAEITTHAALTGHLVLSTLHTNDAPSALTRLLDLGVAPYLVASTVEAVLAQRLVRVICDHCREPVAVEPAMADAFPKGTAPKTVQRGRGCDHCRGTGYRGRTGIYELLVMNDDLRRALQQGAGEIRRLAIAGGMRTLRDDGLRQVVAGVTTLDEVLRVTPR
jgi:general secretion pathway protein E